MRLSAPKNSTFWLSLILAILSVVATFVVAIPFVSAHAYVILVIALVVLAVGNLIKGF
jgi:hypothetical protein